MEDVPGWVRELVANDDAYKSQEAKDIVATDYDDLFANRLNADRVVILEEARRVDPEMVLAASVHRDLHLNRRGQDSGVHTRRLGGWL